MEALQFRYKNSTIGYRRFGTGSRTVICFHGYGEEAGNFGFLEKYAGSQFTFYAIDLPFHGQTAWKDGIDFTSADLLQIMQVITQRENQQPVTSNQSITLLGFSLGGRIALSLYQEIPGSIERLVLLAPDGLKVNRWYWLATQTWLGNRFFAFTMKRPSWFFFFLKILNKLKLVNSSIFKFVTYYIGDAEVRRLLYTRWTTLRRFKPDTGKIKKQVLAANTSVRLLYGQHDRIILPVVGEKFIQGIEENASIAVIPSGHQVLHEKHAAEIVTALLH